MRIGKLFVCAVSMAALGFLHAAELNLEKDYRKEIALYRIRPDQSRSLKREPDGLPVTESQLKEAVHDFYEWLYPLDPAFLKRFQIKSVVFKDTVFDRDGNTFQRRLIGGDLYLDADLDDKQFYATMFLLQVSVMQRSYLGRWNKLNPDGFEYEDMRGNLSGNAQKKLDAVLAEWDKYFVSRTGMYSTEMDMALTFAYMVTKGPDATRFVKKNSPDVQKKFDLVVEIMESVKAAERGYMQTLLADDLSQLKSYVPYALSVRLEREYAGEWSAPKDDGEEDGEEPDDGQTATQAPLKIGDPVEVAGRKIIPLILALETKNGRLFDLLMQNKVNPNVVNDKKVSALMLAIANNDPEQVKALLKAGAKVTQDEARAGTASGVNAEIVKLMNSYLPGVRQSDRPETKKTEKKTADASRKPADTGLTKRLKETQFNHIDLEEVALANVIQLLRTKCREKDTRGEGIQISVPSKYAGMAVTISADSISVYDILQNICRNSGLKMLIEEPNRVILFGSDSGQVETGKKNGSAKKKQ